MGEGTQGSRTLPVKRGCGLSWRYPTNECGLNVLHALAGEQTPTYG